MRKSFLPFSPPLIGEEEIAEVVDTLRSEWITTGPKVKRFEQEFASFVGASHALAVSSCTAALHLALLSLGVGPGDAVITSPMTFCSGVHVIEHVGARPILVDVEPDTLNIDVQNIPAAIKHASELGLNVKAIMPVHLFGQPCDMDSIISLAAQYKLAVIEDAAHSLPAKYKGTMIGSHGSRSPVPVITCFSFYATKNMTTAEGGMLVADPEFVERARPWSLHGMNRDAWNRYGSQGSWFYDVVCPGYKYNMTDIQAALGLRQLRRLEALYARRKELARQYNESLSHLEEVELPTERQDTEHAWHLYVVRLNVDRLTITRDEFISQLRTENIGTSVHFIPIHLHRYYQNKYGYAATAFPTATREYRRMISIPLSPRMTREDASDVVSAIHAISQRHKKKPSQYEMASV